MDIPRSAHNFRFFASSALHHTSDCTQMDHTGCLNYTIRSPVGVGKRPQEIGIIKTCCHLSVFCKMVLLCLQLV